MTESKFVEPPKNEVTIECPSFSDEEKMELETFLKSQPGVQSVRHQMYVMDSGVDRDTLGLITHLPWWLAHLCGFGKGGDSYISVGIFISASPH